MNFSGIFKKKTGESDLEWGWRVYTVIRGSSHTRFAIRLLFLGMVLLTAPSLLLQFITYLWEISFPEQVSVGVDWVHIAGIFCLITACIIYGLFEFLEVEFKKKAEKNLPLLVPTNKPTRSLSALKFSARGVTNFSGRKLELSKLIKFIECDDKISWWVLGGIGGSGKSRLALELCNQCIEQGWVAGFYDHHISANSLSQWLPCQPHLIVLDYAAKDEEQVRALLKYAIQLDKQDKLKFSVRILLAERDAQGTIDFIGQTETVGAELKDYIFEGTPLQLHSLKHEAIELVVKDLCKFFKVPRAKRASVLDYVRQSPSERKLLIAGLYALNIGLAHEPEFEITIEKLINDLIKHERETYWKKFNIIGDKEDYLLVSTMADGIYLTDTSKYGTEAKVFIENFDFAESYSKVVGEMVTKKLTPLSHDVVSELYVLNNFNPEKEKDRIRFHQLLKICFQMGAYQGVISFFTRAANDWPRHTTLRMLLPRFGQTEVELSTWLVLMSNIIDKIEISLVEKVEIFNHVFFRVGQEAPEIANKLFSVFEGLFLRLLSEASYSDTLNPWVREYGIIASDSVELPEANKPLSQGELLGSVTDNIEIAPNLKVKPLDYCNAVITVFTQVDEECKKFFIWHGLLEVFHHKALHLVVNRESDLAELKLFLSEVINIFDAKWSLNIIFRDVLAGLVQFGHYHKNKQQIVDIADYLLEVSTSRDYRKNLDGLLMVISSLYGHTGQAYEKRKDLANVWDNYFSKKMYLSERVGSEFLGFAVQLMSSYRDREGAEYALERLETAKLIVQKFPTPKNLESIMMSLTQLCRNTPEFFSVDEVDIIYKDSVELVKNYGDIAPEIVKSLIQELASLFKKSVTVGDQNQYLYFDDAIKICHQFSSSDFGATQLYMDGIFSVAMKVAIDKNDEAFLFKLCDTVNELKTYPQVHNLSNFWQELSHLFNTYMQEVNTNGKTPKALFLVHVAKYWLANITGDDERYVKGVFGHLVEHYELNYL